MTAVSVSPKYQIVIPKEIRESMGIFSGQKVQIMSYQGRIEVIPLRPMKEMKGFLEGIDTSVVREEDRIRMLSIHLPGCRISPVTATLQYFRNQSKNYLSCLCRVLRLQKFSRMCSASVVRKPP